MGALTIPSPRSSSPPSHSSSVSPKSVSLGRGSSSSCGERTFTSFAMPPCTSPPAPFRPARLPLRFIHLLNSTCTDPMRPKTASKGRETRARVARCGHARRHAPLPRINSEREKGRKKPFRSCFRAFFLFVGLGPPREGRDGRIGSDSCKDGIYVHGPWTRRGEHVHPGEAGSPSRALHATSTPWCTEFTHSDPSCPTAHHPHVMVDGSRWSRPVCVG
eukprot:scaffold684_cov345-Pavlova_lutheri.AAC.39